ncbi:MAG: GAF domain-containing protein [Bacteroidetes bacterium]|nr:GAF domain-containing protein [Bacteroidota bacterium]
MRTDRSAAYNLLLKQVKEIISGEPDLIANLANISSLIKMQFGFLWVGWYFAKGKKLVLGPFQGEVACTRIPYGNGVCGTAWKEKKTLIVPDVHKFPGHIACSAKSRSEIVVPVFDTNRNVRMVLDIDSRKKNDFDRKDKKFLEMIGLMISLKYFHGR